MYSILSKSWKRNSSSLYDFENEITGEKLEVKKQQDLQWFDPSKYCDLNQEQEKIIMMFIVWNVNDGLVDFVFTIKLVEFLNKIGWKPEQCRDAKEYKDKYKTDQIKSSLSVKKFLKIHKNQLEILYERKVG